MMASLSFEVALFVNMTFLWFMHQNLFEELRWFHEDSDTRRGACNNMRVTKKGDFLQIGQMAPVRMISPGKSVVNCEIQETTCRNLIPGEKYPRRVNYNCIGTKKF